MSNKSSVIVTKNVTEYPREVISLTSFWNPKMGLKSTNRKSMSNDLQIGYGSISYTLICPGP